MTSRTISPVTRALAPAAALALLLSACGGSEGEGSSSAENKENASAEEGAEGAPDQPSITESGLFASECDGAEGVFTLFSADDGTEITSLIFSTDRAAADTSAALGHGRAPEIEYLEENEDLRGCGGQLISVSPHEHLLLRSYQEVVNGNNVDVFGVVSEEGDVTTLSPEQEVSDFGTPVDHRYPIYDSVNERIIFVEYDTTSNEGVIQAMDLYSGEVSDLGNCDDANRCSEIAVLPQSGIVLHGPLADTIRGEEFVLESPDGETLLYANSYIESTQLFFINIETALADNPDMITGYGSDLGEYQVTVEVDATPQFIDENTLLLESNELAVWEFTEELLAEHDKSDEEPDYFNFDQDHLPVDRTLIPEGPRRNSDALLSPDRTEILFYSTPETGTGSWYRAPVDGSSEPEEAFQLEDLNAQIHTWQ